MSSAERELFSEEEIVALRARWSVQLTADLEGLSRRASLRLLAHRTLGAPAFLGRSAFRARARELQEVSEVGSNEDVEAGLLEAQTWLLSSPSAAPSHAEPEIHDAIAGEDASPQKEPRRVLVVDDDPVQRMVLARQIKKLGFEVETAADGRGALRAGLDGTYVFIFMDRMLPDIEGPRVLATLRHRGLKTPAAILSASIDEIGAEELRAAEVDHCLEKPVRASALRELMGSVAG